MFRPVPKHFRRRGDTMSAMHNPSSVEPRFARIAAMIGDPTRARMLGALLGGACLPAGEIAQAAGVNASTASGHLAKLVDEGLVAVEPQGRHRYYRVANGDVAHVLEALSIVAERPSAADKWQREPYRSLKFARTCYRHLAGELGVQVFDAYRRGGPAWLETIGLDAAPGAHGERDAYPCLDWSERRHHLAGRLASSLLDHFLERRWLARTPQSRALRLTPHGRRALLPLL